MWVQCPLIDRQTAVIAPGGRALMIGVDCATGEILWETPNPDGWKMSHSFPNFLSQHGYLLRTDGKADIMSGEIGEAIIL